MSSSDTNPYRAPRQSEDAGDVGQIAASGAIATPLSPKRGSLLVIFLTVFIDLLGFGMVLPLLPIYAKTFVLEARSHQAAASMSADAESGLIIGLLMASFSAMQFVFAPVWGRLSDRIGRRPVLMIGLAGSVAFYTLFGLATVWENLTLLFIARIGAGIAGATIPTAQAYIADTTTLETRSKGMALIGAAFGLGFALGPLLGAAAVSLDEAKAVAPMNTAKPQAEVTSGEVAAGMGDAAALARRGEAPAASVEKPSPSPGYVAAGLSGLALVLAFFLLPESLKPDSTSAARKLFDFGALGEAIRTPSIGPLLLTLFICILAFANFETTFSMLISGKAPHSPFSFDNPHVLYTFAYIGLVLSFAQGLLVRRLSGKVPESIMAAVGAVLEIVGFSGMIASVSSGQTWQLLVSLTIIVTGFAMMMPSLTSLISRRSDPKKQGGVLGLSQSVSALARILGPMIGLPLLNVWVYLPYCVAGGMMLVGLVMIVTNVHGGRDYGAAPADMLQMEM